MGFEYCYTRIFDEDRRAKEMNKKYWPYHLAVNKSTDTSTHIAISEVERWCYQHFKSSNWRNIGNYFAFKRDQDAMMFILRWS